MTRTSNDEYIAGRLINGYDYKNQAWVVDGRYVACGHPKWMDCGCYGSVHAGEETEVSVATTKEQAVTEFRKLVSLYGVMWTAAVPREAHAKLEEISRVLSPAGMRAALCG